MRRNKHYVHHVLVLVALTLTHVWDER